MTSKRKHQLERIVRSEFKPFDNAVNNYTYIELLYRITALMVFKISYLLRINLIDYHEVDFMRECVIRYRYYYKKLIKHNIE